MQTLPFVSAFVVVTSCSRSTPGSTPNDVSALSKFESDAARHGKRNVQFPL